MGVMDIKISVINKEIAEDRKCQLITDHFEKCQMEIAKLRN